MLLSIVFGGSLTANSRSHSLNSNKQFYRFESILDSLSIVPNYLKACDYVAVIFRLSKKLRCYIMDSDGRRGGRVILTPGLFQTAYGEEFQCRLHPHQVNKICLFKYVFLI